MIGVFRNESELPQKIKPIITLIGYVATPQIGPSKQTPVRQMRILREIVNYFKNIFWNLGTIWRKINAKDTDNQMCTKN